jgi:hypothetical protein
MTVSYVDLLDKIASGEIPDEAISDTLEGAIGTIEEKGINVAKYAASLDSTAERIAAEEKRLAARRKAIEARADAMRRYLKDNMQRCGITKITHPLYTITLSGSTPRVVIDDEASIPDFYVTRKVTQTVDKAEIARSIKAGEDVPGAHLEETTKLTIR